MDEQKDKDKEKRSRSPQPQLHPKEKGKGEKVDKKQGVEQQARVLPPWRSKMITSQTTSGGSSSASKAAPAAAPPRKKGKKGGEQDEKDEEMPGEKDDKDKKKGKGKRPGHRGGRRASHREKTYTGKDKSLKELLKMLIKLTLSNSHKLRLLQPSAWDTFIMKEDHEVYQALLSEMDNYRAQVAAAKSLDDTEAQRQQLREIGSPAAGMAMSLLEALYQADIGRGVRKNIETELHKIAPPIAAEGAAQQPVATSRTQLEEVVNWVRLEKCKDEAKVKVLISAKTWEAMPYIKEAFVALGDIEHLKGAPPSGWLEDEVATWLEALQ